MKIYIPKRLNPNAAKIYRQAAGHMLDMGIFHKADQYLLETYANLVARIHTMEADDQVEDIDGRARTLAVLATRLESLSRQLGIDYKSRKAMASTAAGRGRPKKNAGITAPGKDKADWLAIIDGGKK